MATVANSHQEKALSGAPADPSKGIRPGRGKEVLLMAAVAVIYFGAGKLGLKLAYVHPSATAVWPPTGIALAALLLLGYRMWPGIFIGALLVNMTTAGSLPVCLGIAVGNTVEGLLGCYLLNRFAGGKSAFDSAKGILAFVLLAAMFSTTLSATLGTASLMLGGFARWPDFGPIWLTWWLGDAVGDLLVAPLLIFFSVKPQLKWNSLRVLEVTFLLLYLVFAGQLAFGGLYLSKSKNYPLEFLCVPALIWAAFRFRPRRAALATCLLAGIAVRGTLRGIGPFVRETQNESLLLVQAFTGVMTMMTLLLAAVVEEQKRTEEKVRELAVTDPLTGLANYRKLFDVLNAEIRRSGRTGRPFAVMLLDLDGLKKINDAHGHLVGSRALCRVAEALRVSSRVTDTPARYGGDEFALVLPEASGVTAEAVAQRIAQRLAGDLEPPPVSASVGFAVFPADGRTVEALLQWADAALYRMKSRIRPS
jgi:diguanylate cyclase (GGDEF)-like protein